MRQWQDRGSEACDDGNAKSGDGCSSMCTIETGYVCPFANAPCVPNCGDGIVLAPMEQCDPGVQRRTWRRHALHLQVESRLACGGTLRAATDGVRDGRSRHEACDDGNTMPNDGCSPTCQLSRNAVGPPAPAPPSAGTGWSSTKSATMETRPTATVARRLAQWSPATSALSPIPALLP